MSAEMKTWTWQKLDRFLRNLPIAYQGHAVRLPVREVLELCPVKYQKALAVAFSVAKWNPRRPLPKHPCGLCELYEKILDTSCEACPLYLHEGHNCYDDRSLFHRAYFDNDEEATQKLYAELCDIYKKEYDKLLEEKTLEEAGSIQ